MAEDKTTTKPKLRKRSRPLSMNSSGTKALKERLYEIHEEETKKASDTNYKRPKAPKSPFRQNKDKEDKNQQQPPPMLTKNSNSKIVRKLTKKKQKKKGSESDGLGWEKSHDSSEGLISPGRDSNPTFEDLNLPSLTDSGDREITKEIKFKRQNSFGRQKSFKGLKKSVQKAGTLPLNSPLFPIVTEEEMFSREPDDTSFRVYVPCDDSPAGFYECTFKHPTTIAQVGIDLCLEFQSFSRNIATHRMHIVARNDPLDKKSLVLPPVHKGENDAQQTKFSSCEDIVEQEKKVKKEKKPAQNKSVLLTRSSTATADGKTLSLKKSPRSPPLKNRASSPCNFLGPSLRPTSPCENLSVNIGSFRPSSARGRNEKDPSWEAKGEEEREVVLKKSGAGEEDWEGPFKNGELPFLLHPAMYVSVHEIQALLDARDLEYRFIMMRPPTSQQLEIIDQIVTDDLSEWEGLIGQYYWGPLAQDDSNEGSVKLTSSLNTSLTISTSVPSVQLSSYWTSRVDIECEKKGWKVEDGRRLIMDSNTLKPIKLLRPRTALYLCAQPYASFFLNRNHDNYIAGNDDCPVVISVEKLDDENKGKTESGLKLLVRSGLDDMRGRTHSSSAKEIAKILSGIRPSLSGLKLKKIVTDATIQRLLLNFELNTQLPQKMKFGVLCCKPGQTLDDEMFANQSGSEHYEKFLSFLGEKIRLKGWDGYRGGLDVNNDTTGEYGLYTKFSDVDIIFHVSTLLPFDVADKQHLERKRHLGNDVCVVIFIDIPEEEEKKEWEVRDKQKAKKEEGKEKPEEIEIGKKEIEKETDEKEAEKETEKETEEEKEKKDTEENEKETDEKEKTEEEKIEDLLKRGLFHPSSISSHFNHVFLVVSVNHRATRETGTTHYNITIANKAGVRPFEPFIPGEPMEQNDETRQLILTKLINGEVTALTAPEFMHSQQRTRTQLLKQLIKDIQESK